MAIAILDIDGTLVDTNYHHALAWFRALARFDARDIVDGWTTSADVEETKPAPDLVHAALERVGASGDEMAVIVGDTRWDVKAAQKAGVPTLAVITGGFSEQELRDAGAAAVFESVADLESRLDETPLVRDEQRVQTGTITSE